jgi:hypothetical protein
MIIAYRDKVVGVCAVRAPLQRKANKEKTGWQ